MIEKMQRTKQSARFLLLLLCLLQAGLSTSANMEALLELEEKIASYSQLIQFDPQSIQTNCSAVGEKYIEYQEAAQFSREIPEQLVDNAFENVGQDLTAERKEDNQLGQTQQALLEIKAERKAGQAQLIEEIMPNLVQRRMFSRTEILMIRSKFVTAAKEYKQLILEKNVFLQKIEQSKEEMDELEMQIKEVQQTEVVIKKMIENYHREWKRYEELKKKINDPNQEKNFVSQEKEFKKDFEEISQQLNALGEKKQEIMTTIVRKQKETKAWTEKVKQIDHELKKKGIETEKLQDEVKMTMGESSSTQTTKVFKSKIYSTMHSQTNEVIQKVGWSVSVKSLERRKLVMRKQVKVFNEGYYKFEEGLREEIVRMEILDRAIEATQTEISKFDSFEANNKGEELQQQIRLSKQPYIDQLGELQRQRQGALQKQDEYSLWMNEERTKCAEEQKLSSGDKQLPFKVADQNKLIGKYSKLYYLLGFRFGQLTRRLKEIRKQLKQQITSEERSEYITEQALRRHERVIIQNEMETEKNKIDKQAQQIDDKNRYTSKYYVLEKKYNVVVQQMQVTVTKLNNIQKQSKAASAQLNTPAGQKDQQLKNTVDKMENEIKELLIRKNQLGQLQQNIAKQMLEEKQKDGISTATIKKLNGLIVLITGVDKYKALIKRYNQVILEINKIFDKFKVQRQQIHQLYRKLENQNGYTAEANSLFAELAALHNEVGKNELQQIVLRKEQEEILKLLLQLLEETQHEKEQKYKSKLPKKKEVGFSYKVSTVSTIPFKVKKIPLIIKPSPKVEFKVEPKVEPKVKPTVQPPVQPKVQPEVEPKERIIPPVTKKEVKKYIDKWTGEEGWNWYWEEYIDSKGTRQYKKKYLKKPTGKDKVGLGDEEYSYDTDEFYFNGDYVGADGNVVHHPIGHTKEQRSHGYAKKSARTYYKTLNSQRVMTFAFPATSAKSSLKLAESSIQTTIKKPQTIGLSTLRVPRATGQSDVHLYSGSSLSTRKFPVTIAKTTYGLPRQSGQSSLKFYDSSIKSTKKLGHATAKSNKGIPRVSRESSLKIPQASIATTIPSPLTTANTNKKWPRSSGKTSSKLAQSDIKSTIKLSKDVTAESTRTWFRTSGQSNLKLAQSSSKSTRPYPAMSPKTNIPLPRIAVRSTQKFPSISIKSTMLKPQKAQKEVIIEAKEKDIPKVIPGEIPKVAPKVIIPEKIPQVIPKVVEPPKIVTPPKEQIIPGIVPEKIIIEKEEEYDFDLGEYKDKIKKYKISQSMKTTLPLGASTAESTDALPTTASKSSISIPLSDVKSTKDLGYAIAESTQDLPNTSPASSIKIPRAKFQSTKKLGESTAKTTEILPKTTSTTSVKLPSSKAKSSQKLGDTIAESTQKLPKTVSSSSIKLPKPSLHTTIRLGKPTAESTERLPKTTSTTSVKLPSSKAKSSHQLGETAAESTEKLPKTTSGSSIKMPRPSLHTTIRLGKSTGQSTERLPKTISKTNINIPSSKAKSSQSLGIASTESTEKLPKTTSGSSIKLPHPSPHSTIRLGKASADSSEQLPKTISKTNINVPSSKAKSSHQLGEASAESTEKLPNTTPETTIKIPKPSVQTTQALGSPSAASTNQLPKTISQSSLKVPSSKAKTTHEQGNVIGKSTQKLPKTTSAGTQKLPQANMKSTKKLGHATVESTQTLPRTSSAGTIKLPASTTQSTNKIGAVSAETTNQLPGTTGKSSQKAHAISTQSTLKKGQITAKHSVKLPKTIGKHSQSLSKATTKSTIVDKKSKWKDQSAKAKKEGIRVTDPDLKPLSMHSRHKKLEKEGQLPQNVEQFQKIHPLPAISPEGFRSIASSLRAKHSKSELKGQSLLHLKAFLLAQTQMTGQTKTHQSQLTSSGRVKLITGDEQYSKKYYGLLSDLEVLLTKYLIVIKRIFELKISIFLFTEKLKKQMFSASESESVKKQLTQMNAEFSKMEKQKIEDRKQIITLIIGMEEEKLISVEKFVQLRFSSALHKLMEQYGDLKAQYTLIMIRMKVVTESKHSITLRIRTLFKEIETKKLDRVELKSHYYELELLNSENSLLDQESIVINQSKGKILELMQKTAQKINQEESKIMHVSVEEEIQIVNIITDMRVKGQGLKITRTRTTRPVVKEVKEVVIRQEHEITQADLDLEKQIKELVTTQSTLTEQILQIIKITTLLKKQMTIMTQMQFTTKSEIQKYISEQFSVKMQMGIAKVEWDIYEERIRKLKIEHAKHKQNKDIDQMNTVAKEINGLIKQMDVPKGRAWDLNTKFNTLSEKIDHYLEKVNLITEKIIQFKKQLVGYEQKQRQLEEMELQASKEENEKKLLLEQRIRKSIEEGIKKAEELKKQIELKEKEKEIECNRKLEQKEPVKPQIVKKIEIEQQQPVIQQTTKKLQQEQQPVIHQTTKKLQQEQQQVKPQTQRTVQEEQEETIIVKKEIFKEEKMVEDKSWLDHDHGWSQFYKIRSIAVQNGQYVKSETSKKKAYDKGAFDDGVFRIRSKLNEMLLYEMDKEGKLGGTLFKRIKQDVDKYLRGLLNSEEILVKNEIVIQSRVLKVEEAIVKVKRMSEIIIEDLDLCQIEFPAVKQEAEKIRGQKTSKETILKDIQTIEKELEIVRKKHIDEENKITRRHEIVIEQINEIEKRKKKLEDLQTLQKTTKPPKEILVPEIVIPKIPEIVTVSGDKITKSDVVITKSDTFQSKQALTLETQESELDNIVRHLETQSDKFENLVDNVDQQLASVESNLQKLRIEEGKIISEKNKLMYQRVALEKEIEKCKQNFAKISSRLLAIRQKDFEENCRQNQGRFKEEKKLLDNEIQSYDDIQNEIKDEKHQYQQYQKQLISIRKPTVQNSKHQAKSLVQTEAQTFSNKTRNETFNIFLQEAKSQVERESLFKNIQKALKAVNQLAENNAKQSRILQEQSGNEDKYALMKSIKMISSHTEKITAKLNFILSEYPTDQSNNFYLCNNTNLEKLKQMISQTVNQVDKLYELVRKQSTILSSAKIFSSKEKKLLEMKDKCSLQASKGNLKEQLQRSRGL